MVDCPTNDFKQGKPSGKCWGVGHYDCKLCQHYRRDFKKNGQDYIDFVHEQNKIKIYSLK